MDKTWITWITWTKLTTAEFLETAPDRRMVATDAEREDLAQIIVRFGVRYSLPEAYTEDQ